MVNVEIVVVSSPELDRLLRSVCFTMMTWRAVLSSLLAILICLQLPTSAQAGYDVTRGEADALLQFKSHLSHSSQSLLRGWDANNTHSICTNHTSSAWVGVTCYRNHHRIQSINLKGFGITGFVAPHLGNLTFILSLDLSNNSFLGSIPPQLSGCASLRELNLSYNNLSGPIPPSFSSLSSLRSLRLCQNFLTGPIPKPLLTNYSSLVTLSLCHNAFTGVIPTDIPSPALEWLDLSGNNFTGGIAQNLVNHTSLILLYLGSNQLTGSIPSELGSLHRLQVIALHDAGLEGVIPSSLANCTELVQLDFSSNQLSGTIPSEVLGALTNLEAGLWWSNHLSGSIPPSVGNCSKLIILEFSFNQMTGAIPDQLGLLSELERLSLNDNNLTGSIPRSLGNCTQIAFLQLESNGLIDHIPSELGIISSLNVLLLWNNSLTGAIPPSLGNCTNLIRLELSFNQLTSSIPTELTRLGILRELRLSQNYLSGDLKMLDFGNFTVLLGFGLRVNNLSGFIPSELGRMRQLQYLDLGANSFSNEIPWESLYNCSFLSYLYLADNYLSGEIPNIFRGLPNLQKLSLSNNLLRGSISQLESLENPTLLGLDLSSNELNGSLPSSLARALSAVSALYLSDNKFSGPLPSWLGELVEVQYMFLSGNQFVGSIPESLCLCVGLIELNLSHNHLSGELPAHLGRLVSLTTLDISSNNLTGELPSFQGLSSLLSLNVSFNNFSGSIPVGGIFKHLNASYFQGNPRLCGPVIHKACISDSSIVHKHGRKLSWKAILGITLSSSLMGASLVVLALWCCARCKCFHKLPVDVPVDVNWLGMTKRYTEEELAKATQEYSESNLLGQGALAKVYKGTLLDGMVIVVKKFREVCLREALLQEVQILSKLRHRNLVRVLGCVLNLELNALVLEYMPNGSLEQYLYHHDGHRLSWRMLTDIALGVASALTYLHHDYGVPIIHGDVKPHNILLDSEFMPHLADFGLAKLVHDEEAVSKSSGFKGSIGYMAPEYACEARITIKVDVYSFGVVVLEMLTGRKPTLLPGTESLHEWVKARLVEGEGLHGEVLNPSLSNDEVASNITGNIDDMAVQLIQMGIACTVAQPNDRPKMERVLAFLLQIRKDHFDASI